MAMNVIGITSPKQKSPTKSPPKQQISNDFSFLTNLDDSQRLTYSPSTLDLEIETDHGILWASV